MPFTSIGDGAYSRQIGEFGRRIDVLRYPQQGIPGKLR